MVRLGQFVFLAAVVTLSRAINTDKFYITEPACESQGCTVNVTPNSTLHINWLNPVNGKINILLVPEDGQKKNVKQVTIAKGIAAHNNDDKCQKYDAKSCGTFDWHVPANVKPGKYSIDIHSMYKKGIHGYSDIIKVTKGAAQQTLAKPATSTPSAEKRADGKVSKHKHDKNAKKGTEKKGGKDDVTHHHKNSTKVDEHHHHHKNTTIHGHDHHHKNKTVHEHEHHHKNKTVHQHDVKSTSKHHHHNATSEDKHNKKTKDAHHKDHKATKDVKDSHSKKHNLTESHEHKKHHNSTSHASKEQHKKHKKSKAKSNTKRMSPVALF